MSLASLFNVPATPDEWAVWSFSHMDQHRQILLAIARQKNENLSEYILDPMPLQSLDGWVWNHQQMHNDFDGVLGLGGFDLTGLDVENEGQVAAWIRLHASEHFSAAQILGF